MKNDNMLSDDYHELVVSVGVDSNSRELIRDLSMLTSAKKESTRE